MSRGTQPLTTAAAWNLTFSLASVDSALTCTNPQQTHTHAARTRTEAQMHAHAH